jgi:membrane protease YdiL (CAAX protease family)
MSEVAFAPPVARVWKFWGSLLWAVAIFVAMTSAQIAIAVAILKWRSSAVEFSDLAGLSSDGVAVALTVFATAPAVVAVIWLAVRLARVSLAEYLALKPFTRRELLLGLACLVACALGVDAMAWAAGHAIVPAFVFDTLASAEAAHALPLFLAAVAAVAPLSEELTVRGFLYSGFAASWLGPAGAILVTSALWASIHVQYDWFFIGEVFTLGLILGWMRYRSGSTWLTVILHGVYNLIAVAQAALLA